jgi:C-terminal processing protease CtpA/Prc
VGGGRWRVSKTVERGPADAAGVKPGAQLSRVGDKRVLGLTAADIAALVRGRPGSRVDMAFTQDDGSEETRSVERACA